MTKTAILRLAFTLAAVITAAAVSSSARAGADPKGPETAGNTTPTVTSPDSRPTREKKRETYPFRGVVGAIDVSARTLTLEGKQTRRVIHFTETTRVEKHGKVGLFEDLKVGETVGGTLKKDPSGREEALLVRVGPKAETPGTGREATSSRTTAGREAVE